MLLLSLGRVILVRSKMLLGMGTMPLTFLIFLFTRTIVMVVPFRKRYMGLNLPLLGRRNSINLELRDRVFKHGWNGPLYWNVRIIRYLFAFVFPWKLVGSLLAKRTPWTLKNVRKCTVSARTRRGLSPFGMLLVKQINSIPLTCLGLVYGC